MRMTPSAHVELFKRDEETGRKMLVHTSRPCQVCGKALEGLVVPYKTARGEQQVHSDCRRRTRGF